MHTALSEPTHVTGRLVFNNFELTTPRAREIDARLRAGHDMPAHVWHALMRELAMICPVRSLDRTNIVVLSGRSVMARLLLGDTTYSGAVNMARSGPTARPSPPQIRLWAPK